MYCWCGYIELLARVYIPKTLFVPIFVIFPQKTPFCGFQLISNGGIYPSLSPRYSQNISVTFALEHCLSRCLINNDPHPQLVLGNIQLYAPPPTPFRIQVQYHIYLNKTHLQVGTFKRLHRNTRSSNPSIVSRWMVFLQK